MQAELGATKIRALDTHSFPTRTKVIREQACHVMAKIAWFTANAPEARLGALMQFTFLWNAFYVRPQDSTWPEAWPKPFYWRGSEHANRQHLLLVYDFHLSAWKKITSKWIKSIQLRTQRRLRLQRQPRKRKQMIRTQPLSKFHGASGFWVSPYDHMNLGPLNIDLFMHNKSSR